MKKNFLHFQYIWYTIHSSFPDLGSRWVQLYWGCIKGCYYVSGTDMLISYVSGGIYPVCMGTLTPVQYNLDKPDVRYSTAKINYFQEVTFNGKQMGLFVQ